jgi:ferredoxin
MEIIVDATLCQGHAQCIELAPSLFELDANGRSRVRRAPQSAAEEAAAENAEVMCPEQAIRCIRDAAGSEPPG